MRAVHEEALSRRASDQRRSREDPPPLGECVGHAVAKHEAASWSSSAVGGEPRRRMNTAQDEGDIWAHGAMKEIDVLERLAESALAGVDLLASTEERDRLQSLLLIDPVSPQLAIGNEEAEADIGHGFDAGLDELVVVDGRTPDIYQLTDSVESVVKS